METKENIHRVPVEVLLSQWRTLQGTPEADVLWELIQERKKRIEKAIWLTEAALMKAFQANFVISLLDDLRYYREQLKIIETLIVV